MTDWADDAARISVPADTHDWQVVRSASAAGIGAGVLGVDGWTVAVTVDAADAGSLSRPVLAVMMLARVAATAALTTATAAVTAQRLRGRCGGGYGAGGGQVG